MAYFYISIYTTATALASSCEADTFGLVSMYIRMSLLLHDSSTTILLYSK